MFSDVVCLKRKNRHAHAASLGPAYLRLLGVNPKLSSDIKSGCAYSMPWVDQAAALVQLWYSGLEAGNAITDVIFGDESY